MKEPYPFQLENIKAGVDRHILIADDCGLGKTLSAIEIGKAIRRRGSALLGITWRALVVCPKGVRLQWMKELAEQDPASEARIVEIHEEITGESSGWHVIHYEALMARPPADLLWDYIVVDEAHRIRNRKAIRTKAIKLLSSMRRVALTGTPMDKDPSELWSIWQWLYPSEFTSYWRFRQTYCLMGENYLGFQQVLGPRNVDQLAKQLKGRFMKHTKEMVVKDLPPKIFIDVPIQMEGEQLQMYEAIRKSKDIEVTTPQGDLVIPSALAKITRLQQAASAGITLGDEFDVPSCKVDWTLEFIDDHPELSVVVFTRFVATAQRILDRLTEVGVQACGFFGSKKSFPIEFLNGEVRILVATIAKAGEGLDLKRTNAAIFVDQEWSTIKMQQAYDRIHRLGIDMPKNLYMLKCSPVDYLISEKIERKWDDAQFVYEAVQRHMLNGEAT